MIRPLRPLASAAIAIVLAGCSASHSSSTTQSSAVGAATPTATDSLGFCETYEDCRAGFRSAAAAGGATQVSSVDDVFASADPDASVEPDASDANDAGLGPAPQGASMWAEEVPSEDTDLTMDFAFFPAQDGNTQKLVVLSSGVHGLEGFTGSTLQQVFLSQMLQGTVNTRNLNVLLVHAVNPYGFRHGLRVTEHRVDLNRNWLFPADAYPSFPQPMPDDSLYDSYTSLLDPSGPGDYSDVDFGVFALSLAEYIPSIESGKLTQAAAQGQYHVPNGVEFGGSGYEPNVGVLLHNVTPFFNAFSDVMVVDLHTGLGNQELQLLPNAPRDAAFGARQAAIFQVDGHEIIGTGGETFYSSYGDFSDFLCSTVIGLGKTCVSMLIEFGTLINPSWSEDPSLVQAFKTQRANAMTLYLSVRENEIANYGAASGLLESGSDLETQFYSDYRAQFFPTDTAWRQMVLDQTESSLPKMLDNFVVN